MTGRGRGRGGGGDRGGAPRGGGGGGGDRGGRGGGPARGGGGGADRGRGRGGGAWGGSDTASHAGTVSSTGGGGGGRGRGSDRGGGGGGGPGARGRGRGGPGGGPGGGGAAPVSTGAVQASVTNYGNPAVSIARHVEPLGALRPSHGVAGKPIDIVVNAFQCVLPNSTIHHYDGAYTFSLTNPDVSLILSPSSDDLLADTIVTEKTLPTRATVPIIRAMQDQHRNVFTRRAVYDGKKNLYSTVLYSFGDQQEFQFAHQGINWRVRLQKAATINPEVLSRYVAGQANWDEAISTYLNACNVAVRMQPIETYPFNTRSFFTNAERKDLGKGLELWRGYFQSVRPGIGRMFINLDISSAVFYKSGPLIGLLFDILGLPPGTNPNTALGQNMDNRRKQEILKAIRGLNVRTDRAGQNKTRSIKGLSAQSAQNHTFQSETGPTTVAAYFSLTTGQPLRYPGVLSVQLSSKAFVPLERCEVLPGQMMRRQVPKEMTKDVVEFSTMRPEQRLQSIRNGLQVLQYGNSPYLQDFGINVQANPMSIKGRLLTPPVLQYAGSTIQPRDGAWNMRERKLYKPATILGIVLLVFDARFRAGDRVMAGLHEACNDLGIIGCPATFPVENLNAQAGNYPQQIRDAAMRHKQRLGKLPNLILAVLPDFGGDDIYNRMKHAGDIDIGVATQCLKGSKVFKANAQYWANVCLKINVKLGGINVVPQANPAIRVLIDPSNPTLVIGADVQHPGPGAQGRPSFAAATGNVDGNVTKYVAISRPQATRVEMIQELDKMVLHLLKMYMNYRTTVEKATRAAPKRIIFYRDGISEGQFKECKEFEIPKILKACKDAGIAEMPKLTFVVVGKRHHMRFFPVRPGDADRSGNVPAGLVVDRDITSPVEYDFYLQSHGGLLGTSRSAHYNVLVDDNNFGPDDLQKMSFALCHVYARSTRSVSIVPPVYYADTICARAKTHYNPDSNIGDLSETETTMSSSAAEQQLQIFQQGFRALHSVTSTNMYFQ